MTGEGTVINGTAKWTQYVYQVDHRLLLLLALSERLLSPVGNGHRRGSWLIKVMGISDVWILSSKWDTYIISSVAQVQ